MGFPPTHRGHQYRGRNISLPMHPPGTRAGLSRPQLKPPSHTTNNNHTPPPHPQKSNIVVFALTVAPRCQYSRRIAPIYDQGMCIPESFTPLVRLLPHDFVIMLVGAQPSPLSPPRRSTNTNRHGTRFCPVKEIHPSWKHAVTTRSITLESLFYVGTEPMRVMRSVELQLNQTRPRRITTPTRPLHPIITVVFHKLGRGSVSSLQRPSHTQNLHTFVARKIRSVHAVPDWEQH